MDWQGSIVSSMGRRIAARLAENVRHLREARALTQEQVARLAGIPRATWGHLETGAANPTLAVLDKVATALQVQLDELTAEARSIRLAYRKGTLRSRQQCDGLVQQLL